MLTIKTATWDGRESGTPAPATKTKKNPPPINPLAPGSQTPNAQQKRNKVINETLGVNSPNPKPQVPTVDPGLQDEFTAAYNSAVGALRGFGSKFNTGVIRPYNAACVQFKEILDSAYQRAQSGNIPDNQFVKSINQITQTMVQATQALNNDTAFVQSLTQQLSALSGYLQKPMGERGPNPNTPQQTPSQNWYQRIRGGINRMVGRQ